jgi:hypothetical protein
MSARKTVPPAYLTYRGVLIAVIVALLVVTGFVFAAEFATLWQGVLSGIRNVRQSWTNLGWTPT